MGDWAGDAGIEAVERVSLIYSSMVLLNVTGQDV